MLSSNCWPYFFHYVNADKPFSFFQTVGFPDTTNPQPSFKRKPRPLAITLNINNLLPRTQRSPTPKTTVTKPSTPDLIRATPTRIKCPTTAWNPRWTERNLYGSSWENRNPIRIYLRICQIWWHMVDISRTSRIRWVAAIESPWMYYDFSVSRIRSSSKNVTIFEVPLQ